MPYKFDKIKSGDEALDRVQINIAKALDPVLGLQILDGRKVDVELTGSVAIVAHGLGRVPNGWILMTVDNDTRLYEDKAASPDRSKLLVMKSSAASVNFSLWVF